MIKIALTKHRTGRFLFIGITLVYLRPQNYVLRLILPGKLRRLT